MWPYLGVSVFPEKGSSAMWFNVKSDAQVDDMTLHAACPVLLGQKWSERRRKQHQFVAYCTVELEQSETRKNSLPFKKKRCFFQAIRSRLTEFHCTALRLSKKKKFNPLFFST